MAKRSSSPSDCCSSAQAACISPAATDHFLNELHSTNLFFAVCQCLSQTPRAQIHGWSSSEQKHGHSMPLSALARQPLHDLMHANFGSASAVGASLVMEASGADAAMDASPVDAMDAQNDATSCVTASAETARSLVKFSSLVNDLSSSTDCQSASTSEPSTAAGNDQHLEVAPIESVLAKPTRTSTHGPSSCCSQKLPFTPASSPSLCSEDNLHGQEAIVEDTAGLEGTAGSGAVRQSGFLAERVCMMLLLVPKEAWGYASTQVCFTTMQYVSVAIFQVTHRPSAHTCLHCHRLSMLLSSVALMSCSLPLCLDLMTTLKSPLGKLP